MLIPWCQVDPFWIFLLEDSHLVNAFRRELGWSRPTISARKVLYANDLRRSP